jgi:hypothetical protein
MRFYGGLMVEDKVNLLQGFGQWVDGNWGGGRLRFKGQNRETPKTETVNKAPILPTGI